MTRWHLAVALLFAVGCDDPPAGDPVELPSLDAGPTADAALEPAPDAEAEIAPDAAPDAALPPAYTLPTFANMATAVDLDPDPDRVEIELHAAGTTLDIGGMRVPVRVYDGTLPGPLIQAKVGDEVVVRFQNDLSTATTIHWHGLRISDQMDGNPRIQEPVEADGSFEYRFVVPEAGSFWYHPHVRSHEQIEQGLYGPLVVHDPADPVVDAERFMVIDDILLDEGGRPLPYLASHPEEMHGRHGNILLANGDVAPQTFDAREGGVERWRIVNTANARTFTLRLSGAQFRVVATDGGRIDAPYAVEELRVAVGQRFDLEVRYDAPGEAMVEAEVPVLDEAGDVVLAPFPLYRATVAATGEAPRVIDWPPVEVAPRGVDRDEVMTFDGVNGPSGVRWRISGLDDPEAPLYTFAEGETVRMTITNEQAQEHPFHLHGQWFRVLSHPDPYPVVGLKDTVLVPGNATVEIEAYFDNPGRWMAHCHILEHAALGMMGEIVVTPAE